MTENEIAKLVVDGAYRIHTKFGPGLLESAYEAILAYELKKRGLQVVCQQPFPIVYEEVRLEGGYQTDLIVEDKVILSLNSVEKNSPIHKRKLLTHLKLADKRLGLFINFNKTFIKHGIIRVVNNSLYDPYYIILALFMELLLPGFVYYIIGRCYTTSHISHNGRIEPKCLKWLYLHFYFPFPF